MLKPGAKVRLVKKSAKTLKDEEFYDSFYHGKVGTIERALEGNELHPTHQLMGYKKMFLVTFEQADDEDNCEVLPYQYCDPLDLAPTGGSICKQKHKI